MHYMHCSAEESNGNICLLHSRQAFCVIHQRDCPVDSEVAMMHLAGTPCTAASTMGLHNFDHAMSYAHLLAWAGVRRRCQEPIIVQENVLEFDRDRLVELLPQYDWTFEAISPCQLGWPVRRARQWCVFRGCISLCMSSYAVAVMRI